MFMCVCFFFGGGLRFVFCSSYFCCWCVLLGAFVSVLHAIVGFHLEGKACGVGEGVWWLFVARTPPGAVV